MKNIKIHPFIYLFLSILYFEIITKIVIANHFFNIGIIYLIIFSIPFSLLFTILTKSYGKGNNMWKLCEKYLQQKKEVI